MTVNTQEIRGIRVVADEAVRPVRLGITVVGKTPVQLSYPSLPQCFPPAGKPGQRHLHTEILEVERVASRAGRSESHAGDHASRSLASMARQAVLLDWPTAEVWVDADAGKLARTNSTKPLTSNRRPSPAARFMRACVPTLGSDAKSTARMQAGRGAPSATSRGLADGSRFSPDAISAGTKRTRIPPRAV